MSDVKELSFIVKWGGREYHITDLTDKDTVAVLRHEIYKQTEVRPERQKLLNLKFKGKMADDAVELSHIKTKPNFKIMMIGSTEAAIASACHVPDDVGHVECDLEDIDQTECIEKSPVYLSKIRKRVKEYKITEINPPRSNMHLLVLDIDYTLFDHRSPAETGTELMRPYLHEFLSSAYPRYDIVIWSATGMRWIEEKMRLLGVTEHELYKIMFYLDSSAMISVYTPEKGVIDVKPLGLIWGIYPQYTPANTIMIDDIRRNFLMNPLNGLRIKPYRNAHISRYTDIELLKLAKYLRNIAINCKNYTKLNHRKWEQYDPKKESKEE